MTINVLHFRQNYVPSLYLTAFLCVQETRARTAEERSWAASLCREMEGPFGEGRAGNQLFSKHYRSLNHERLSGGGKEIIQSWTHQEQSGETKRYNCEEILKSVMMEFDSLNSVVSWQRLYSFFFTDLIVILICTYAAEKFGTKHLANLIFLFLCS